MQKRQNIDITPTMLDGHLIWTMGLFFIMRAYLVPVIHRWEGEGSQSFQKIQFLKAPIQKNLLKTFELQHIDGVTCQHIISTTIA